MNRKSIISLAVALALMLVCFAGCGTKAPSESTAPAASASAAPAEKVVKVGDLFANTYTSLDAAKESDGWWTSELGLTETLFVIGDDYSIKPCLAESGTTDGKIWTIKLRDNVVFSDGSKLTAAIAAKCLERAPQVNEKAAALKDATITVLDDTTFTIATPEFMPTLLNELTAVYYSIINIDASADIDNAPVCTGPFKVSEFKPGESVVLVKNDKYWNGDVALDRVEGYYMADADTMSLAFQNGELDAYIGPTTNDLEIYNAAPDKYTVTSVPSSRLYYYYLNMERLPDKDLRSAINMAINSDEICTMLSGLASPTIGAFSESSAYGKVTKNSYDPQKAKSLIEGLGYKLNSEGYYEKNGKIIELNIAYYAARSIDKIVLLMQEQLKAVGIKADLTVSEDPDGTYLTTGDFDIGMYCMIAAPAGDPYYYLSRVLDGGLYTSGGYDNADAKALLDQLYSETDTAKRAELSEQMQQMIIDDEAMGFIALLNKITVMRAGVVNCCENNPISFYLINAKTDIQ